MQFSRSAPPPLRKCALRVTKPGREQLLLPFPSKRPKPHEKREARFRWQVCVTPVPRASSPAPTKWGRRSFPEGLGGEVTPLPPPPTGLLKYYHISTTKQKTCIRQFAPSSDGAPNPKRLPHTRFPHKGRSVTRGGGEVEAETARSGEAGWLETEAKTFPTLQNASLPGEHFPLCARVLSRLREYLFSEAHGIRQHLSSDTPVFLHPVWAGGD